jgi:hypothetical protein
MYYKNKNVVYENIGNMNIIAGFPKYFKVFSDGFRVIDTYDLVSVPYYRTLDVKNLVPIDKDEWDIVEGIVNIAYQKRRDQFCD